MPVRAFAAVLSLLALTACAAARQPLSPVAEDPPAAVPAGVRPLTVEQEEDSAVMLPGRPSPGWAPT